MNPANRCSGGRVRDASRGAARPEYNIPFKARKAILTVQFDDQRLTVKGRMAQTLLLLMQCGSKGFTAGEASPLGWARRTSHYVHELRQLGFPIVTKWEEAGDARVGRYILVASVSVVAEGAA